MNFLDFFKRRKDAINATNKREEVLNTRTNISQKFTERPAFTPDNINSLSPDEVFVFGSNLAGHHSGGAARTALNKFGAIYGQGVGLQGQSYAIPTMQGDVETIAPYVDEFIDFAKWCPEKFFYITRIGCDIAGFRDEEIAPLFKKALKLNNICLPESFVSNIEKNEPMVIELSKAILDMISVYDIIYAEIASGGAMGCAGQAAFYIIEKEQLTYYKTNLFTDENTYTQVEEMLFKHSGLKGFPLDSSKSQFNYYYGGMGNHVFVNINISLEIIDNHFVYKNSNNKYDIYSSVFGVFNNVAYLMQNPQNEEKGI